jgi:hypothetical protein
MALTNTNALCLLADLKADLGITGSGSDSMLERRILAASELITSFLNRPLRRDTARVESLPGYGTDKLFPSLAPIHSIASITLEDEVISADSYSIDPTGLMIVAESGWEDTRLVVQSVSSRLNRLPTTEQALFVVTFDGGYTLPNDTVITTALLPPLITEACLMLAATLYGQRGVDGRVQSEQVGGASIQYRVSYEGDGSINGIPKNIAQMLSPYRRAV